MNPFNEPNEPEIPNETVFHDRCFELLENGKAITYLRTRIGIFEGKVLFVTHKVMSADGKRQWGTNTYQDTESRSISDTACMFNVDGRFYHFHVMVYFDEFGNPVSMHTLNSHLDTDLLIYQDERPILITNWYTRFPVVIELDKPKTETVYYEST